MQSPNAEDPIVVDCIEAMEWKESAPSNLRKNLRTNMCELMKDRKLDHNGTFVMQMFNRCELLELHDDATVELDFRVNGVSYTTERYPFVMFSNTTQKTREQDASKLYRASPCYDHMVTNVITSMDQHHKVVQMMRIYTMSDECKQDYKDLLRFVAACCLKARSLTPFVLPLLRAYEDGKNVWHLCPKPYYGTVEAIMNSLSQLQSNSNTQQEINDREAERDDLVGSPLPQNYVLYFSACILQALQLLAAQGISLNRMTTESVMVTHQQIPVLTDFLYASQCSIGSKHALKRKLSELPGQPDDGENDGSGSAGILWPPPELLQGAAGPGDFGRVDVWNFGAFVLLMSVGTETFKHLRSSEHRTSVSQTGTVIALQPCNQMTANNRPCGLTACGPDLLHLISVAMAQSPSRRPTMRILQSVSYYAKTLVEQQQQQPILTSTQLKPQLQMLDQISDVDELLSRLGVQTAMVNEGGAP